MNLNFKWKIILIFCFVVGMALSLQGLYFFQMAYQSYQEEFDVLLHNYTVDVANSLDFGFINESVILKDFFSQEREMFPFSKSESLIQVRNIRGEILDKSYSLEGYELPLLTEELNKLQQHRFVIRSLNFQIKNHKRYRMITYLVVKNPLRHFLLQIAVPDEFILNNSQRILRRVFYSIPFFLIFTGLLGFYFSHIVLKPIKSIIQKTQSITASSLSERIPIQKNQDELGRLIQTLNDLLERIEQAFLSQERFISDASHQLKTPLAIMRGEIEFLKKNLKDSSLKVQISSIEEEIDHLNQLINDLLILARVDAGQSSFQFEWVEMDDLIMNVVGRVKILAERKQNRVILNLMENIENADDPLWKVQGDYDLLASLVQTLIENAIKYSPEKTEIKLTLSKNKGFVEVKIHNQGDSLSQEEIEKVFDRFHRGRRARERAMGSGLGLAIAQRIAQLHEATLSLSNHPEGGVEVDLKIPLHPERADLLEDSKDVSGS